MSFASSEVGRSVGVVIVVVTGICSRAAASSAAFMHSWSSGAQPGDPALLPPPEEVPGSSLNVWALNHQVPPPSS